MFVKRYGRPESHAKTIFLKKCLCMLTFVECKSGWLGNIFCFFGIPGQLKLGQRHFEKKFQLICEIKNSYNICFCHFPDTIVRMFTIHIDGLQHSKITCWRYRATIIILLHVEIKAKNLVKSLEILACMQNVSCRGQIRRSAAAQDGQNCFLEIKS